MGTRKKLKSILNKKSYMPMIKAYSFYRQDIWGFLRWKKAINCKKAIYNMFKYKKKFFKMMLYEIHRGVKFKIKKYREKQHNFFLRRVIRLYYKVFRERFFGKLGRVIKRKAGMLVNHFFSILERRLDMIAVRSFYFDTIMRSRKYIINKNIFVNTMCINNPRFIVNVGDVISFTSKPRYFNFFILWRRFFSTTDFFFFSKHLDKARELYEGLKNYSFVARTYKNVYNKKHRWHKKWQALPRRMTAYNRMFKIFSFAGRFRLFSKKYRIYNVFCLVWRFYKYFRNGVLGIKGIKMLVRWANYLFFYRRQLFLHYRFVYFYSHLTRYVRVRKKGRWVLEKFLRARKKFFLQRLWSMKKSRKRTKSKFFSYFKYLNKYGFVFPLKEKYYRLGLSRQMHEYLSKRDAFNVFFFAGLPPYMEPSFLVHKVIIVCEPTVKHIRYPFMANHFKNYAFFDSYRKRSYF